MPSGAREGALKEITPPPMAVNMLNFSAMAHSAPSISQAAIPVDRQAEGPGGQSQGPPSPEPRVAGYNINRGDTNVHTVSSIPPVHPPVFSDMRKHTRRRSPAIIKVYSNPFLCRFNAALLKTKTSLSVDFN